MKFAENVVLLREETDEKRSVIANAKEQKNDSQIQQRGDYTDLEAAASGKSQEGFLV